MIDVTNMETVVKQKRTQGFALPTVLAASVAMMLVLLASLTAISSLSVSVRTQMYNRLAKEAGDAGINLLVGCIQDNTTTPPSAANYVPNSTDCMTPAPTGTKSACVADNTAGNGNTKYRTTFITDAPESVDNGKYFLLKATGKVELFRTSDTVSCSSGTAIRTIEKKVSLRLEAQTSIANTSTNGSLFTCAIVNYQAKCWGLNNKGQLGIAENDSSTGNLYYWGANPEQDEFGNNIPQVASVMRDSETGLTYGLKDKELDIAAGASNACAMTTLSADPGLSSTTYANRSIVCWGINSFGQLGRNFSASDRVVDTTTIHNPRVTAQPWNGGTPQIPMQLESGAGTVCVRNARASGDTRSNLWCWGNNTHGMVGIDQAYSSATNGNAVRTPQDVLGPGTTATIVVKDVAMMTGAETVCAIRTNNQAACWGENGFGQVGDGTTGSGTFNRVQRPSTVLITGVNTPLYAKAIAVGGTMQDRTNYSTSPDNSGHTCAIGLAAGDTVEDKIYCWGRNIHGLVVGNGYQSSWTDYLRARQITSIGPGGTNYSARLIASSNRAVCAAIKSPTTAPEALYCWGNNTSGEVGAGEPGTPSALAGATNNVYAPIKIPFFDNKTITDLQGGAYRMCAISNGSNYCWGVNTRGHIGDGRISASRFTPSKSLFLEPYRSISY